MKIKTNELIGPALDWAVAQVEGVKTIMMAPRKGQSKEPFALFGSLALSIGGDDQSSYAPSTCWHCGGPLIATHKVNLHTPQTSDDCWAAWVTIRGKDFCHGGWQPLVAACRAIVAAKLGDEVDLPEGLV